MQPRGGGCELVADLDRLAPHHGHRRERAVGGAETTPVGDDEPVLTSHRAGERDPTGVDRSHRLGPGGAELDPTIPPASVRVRRGAEWVDDRSVDRESPPAPGGGRTGGVGRRGRRWTEEGQEYCQDGTRRGNDGDGAGGRGATFVPHERTFR